MVRNVAGQVSVADDLPQIVDCEGHVSAAITGAAQTAKIGDFALFPEKSVQGKEVDKRGQLVGRAESGSTNSLAVAVNCNCHSVGVTANRLELLNLAILPESRLELEHLR